MKTTLMLITFSLFLSFIGKTQNIELLEKSDSEEVEIFSDDHRKVYAINSNDKLAFEEKSDSLININIETNTYGLFAIFIDSVKSYDITIVNPRMFQFRLQAGQYGLLIQTIYDTTQIKYECRYFSDKIDITEEMDGDTLYFDMLKLADCMNIINSVNKDGEVVSCFESRSDLIGQFSMDGLNDGFATRINYQFAQNDTIYTNVFNDLLHIYCIKNTDFSKENKFIQIEHPVLREVNKEQSIWNNYSEEMNHNPLIIKHLPWLYENSFFFYSHTQAPYLFSIPGEYIYGPFNIDYYSSHIITENKKHFYNTWIYNYIYSFSFYKNTENEIVVCDQPNLIEINSPMYNYYTDGDSIVIDNGPLCGWKGIYNDNNEIYIAKNYSSFHSYLPRPLPDYEICELMEIRDSANNVIKSTSKGWKGWGAVSVENAAYTYTQIDSAYFIGGKPGRATYETRFDLRNEDKVPPILSAMQIRNSKNRPHHILNTNEDCSLSLNICDLNSESYREYKALNPNKTKAWAKMHDSATWILLDLKLEDEIKLGLNGHYYEADLSAFTKIAAKTFDLRMHFEDSTGNSVDYTLEPAACTKGYEIPFMIPLAVEDSIFINNESVGLTHNLLANDIGEDPYPLTMTISKETKHGTVVWEPNGDVVYTPNPGFSGIDYCTYYAFNGDFGSSSTTAYFIVDTITSIQNLEAINAVYVYPNPSKKNINIKGLVDSKNAQFTLYDYSGKLMLIEDVTSQSINTSALPKGIYIYEIKQQNKVLGRGKWIKE